MDDTHATHTNRGLVEGRPHRATQNPFLTEPSDYQVRLCKKFNQQGHMFCEQEGYLAAPLPLSAPEPKDQRTRHSHPYLS